MKATRAADVAEGASWKNGPVSIFDILHGKFHFKILLWSQ